MNIGILTFHWGTNYGGVLQAYALQTFLINRGHNVEIINYAPHTFRDSFIKCFYSKNPITIFGNIINYLKERNFRSFRLKHLKLTKRYYTPEQLMVNPPQFDIYITGSDQVWNPYALMSNKKIYFLPFGNKETIKISYAASFSVTSYPQELIEQIFPLLKEFKAISVREESGVKILHDEGYTNAKLLPDPTLLLNKYDYMGLFSSIYPKKKCNYMFYVLQKKQILINEIYKYLKKKNDKIIHTNRFKTQIVGVEQWLSYIYHSKYIITNSFHGVVFSILFQKQFIVVPIEGRLDGMNDRIMTLLERYELEDRILYDFDGKLIENMLNKEIDWEKVHHVNETLKNDAADFFKSNING